MRPRIAGVLLAAAALGSGSPARAGDGEPADAPRPAAGPPRTPDFQAKVDEAIRRGVLWLRSVEASDGAFSGATGEYAFAPSNDLGLQALALYTLRACGAPADDPDVERGFRKLRALYQMHHRTRMLQNYQASLTLLALEAHHAPPADPGPGAGRPGKPAGGPRSIPEEDLAWIRELAAWIARAQTADGSFGYTVPPADWEDHSNAQFSLLALKAARRCGVDVPKGLFRRALAHFLACQQRSGASVVRKETVEAGGKGYGSTTRGTVRDRARGWSYRDRGSGATGTMTTAGTSSVVICRSELLGTTGYTDAEDAKAVQSIRDGIAWLGEHFDAHLDLRSGDVQIVLGGWHYYYLYGLERAGVLAGVSWMGDHDWYLEGAKDLLGRQAPHGSWGAHGTRIPADPARGGRAAGMGSTGGSLLDTCFALLFLKKATFRVEGAVATEEAEGALDLTGAAALDDDTFQAIFDTVFGRYLRSAPEGRGTLVADFVRLGPRAIPLLIRRLEDEDPPPRAAAAEALERVTGQTLGFRSDAPAEARAAAVASWEAWWFARRSKLIADPDAGRFR